MKSRRSISFIKFRQNSKKLSRFTTIHEWLKVIKRLGFLKLVCLGSFYEVETWFCRPRDVRQSNDCRPFFIFGSRTVRQSSNFETLNKNGVFHIYDISSSSCSVNNMNTKTTKKRNMKKKVQFVIF